MSVARWCDYGDHAYKGGRAGTITMGVLQEADSKGVINQEVQEMCPECAASLGLNQNYEAPDSPQERKTKLLESAKKGISQK